MASVKALWATPVGRVRLLGMLEGASFLFLLGVAMPLKYLGAQPLGVQIAGPVHGLLFLWLLVEVAQLVMTSAWPPRRGLGVAGAALVPFGPFAIDRWLARLGSVPPGSG